MERLGIVTAIWRYPVKSLKYEAIEEAEITAQGLRGDREAALIVRDGHARTGKTYRGKEHNLLHTTGETARAVALAAGRATRVEVSREPGVRYFDAAPISILLDRWVADVESHIGRTLDPLRWRPNFFVRAEDAAAYSEGDLVGREIRMGNAMLRVRSGIDRCVTPTFDVESGEPEPEVLNYVARRRDNVMGIYCDVIRAGVARVGDALHL